MRPAGIPKTGGRKKGTPNKATAAKAQAVEESGLTPLDYMLQIMRDPMQDPKDRLDAAKSAAAYVHPKLSSVEAKIKGELSVNTLSDDELDATIAQAAAEAGISLGIEGEGEA